MALPQIGAQNTSGYDDCSFLFKSLLCLGTCSYITYITISQHCFGLLGMSTPNGWNRVASDN